MIPSDSDSSTNERNDGNSSSIKRRSIVSFTRDTSSSAPLPISTGLNTTTTTTNTNASSSRTKGSVPLPVGNGTLNGPRSILKTAATQAAKKAASQAAMINALHSEIVFKILVFGSSGCGKSSIINIFSGERIVIPFANASSSSSSSATNPNPLPRHLGIDTTTILLASFRGRPIYIQFWEIPVTYLYGSCSNGRNSDTGNNHTEESRRAAYIDIIFSNVHGVIMVLDSRISTDTENNLQSFYTIDTARNVVEQRIRATLQQQQQKYLQSLRTLEEKWNLLVAKETEDEYQQYSLQSIYDHPPSNLTDDEYEEFTVNFPSSVFPSLEQLRSTVKATIQQCKANLRSTFPMYLVAHKADYPAVNIVKAVILRNTKEKNTTVNDTTNNTYTQKATNAAANDNEINNVASSASLRTITEVPGYHYQQYFSSLGKQQGVYGYRVPLYDNSWYPSKLVPLSSNTSSSTASSLTNTNRIISSNDKLPTALAPVLAFGLGPDELSNYSQLSGYRGWWWTSALPNLHLATYPYHQFRANATIARVAALARRIYPSTIVRNENTIMEDTLTKDNERTNSRNGGKGSTPSTTANNAANDARSRAARMYANNESAPLLSTNTSTSALSSTIRTTNASNGTNFPGKPSTTITTNNLRSVMTITNTMLAPDPLQPSGSLQYVLTALVDDCLDYWGYTLPPLTITKKDTSVYGIHEDWFNLYRKYSSNNNSRNVSRITQYIQSSTEYQIMALLSSLYSDYQLSPILGPTIDHPSQITENPTVRY